ncbi:MAG: DUF3795 domain-containing protein [Clostridiales bacterium]|nr:DUF3795 domain-containing protein [Clostridiales bacterium]
MKKLIAYCGLDCEKCDARIATLNDDNSLREKVAKLWSKLNGVEITAEMINCEGCRADGVKTPYCDSLCPIRQCALGKGCETCGDCATMDCCRTVGMVVSNNPEALSNLKGTTENK